MNPSIDIDDRVLAEAADWYARLRADDADATTREAFTAWQTADLQHRLAYAEVCALGWALPNVADDVAEAALPAIGVEVLPARAVKVAGPVSARPRLFAWASGALMALLLAAVVPRLGEPLSAAMADHAAPRGERYAASLSDGSMVELDALSRLDVSMTSSARQLRLKSGALFVSVAKDAARPLTVEANGVAVTAIGTRFGVRLSGATVEVAVEEGRVAVEYAGRRVELGAGEQWLIGGDGTPAALDAGSLAWRSGRISFTDRPLSEVLATLARHTPEPVWGLSAIDAGAPISLSVPSGQALIALREVLAERGYRLVQVPMLGYVVR